MRTSVVKIAESVLTPLGVGTVANWEQIRKGETGLRLHHQWNLPEDFCASLFEPAIFNAWVQEQLGKQAETYSRFEQLLILSIAQAIEQVQQSSASANSFDISSKRVLLMVSTTKGNISGLPYSKYPVELGRSVQRVADYFHQPNLPVVVSNACISGLAAQIQAMRLLQAGAYDFIVVTGAEELSPFIVSGFQSFKALSPYPCKPFDKNRKGLNLGEAAATIIYQRKPTAEVGPQEWVIEQGAIRNDANHISGPSRTGEGSYRCLLQALNGIDPASLGFVNVHGTSTNYNDEMESIALDRAGLHTTPVFTLKPYYGHTLGAAGVLEVLLSMQAIDKGAVVPILGLEEVGVSGRIQLQKEWGTTTQKAFIKLLSGFGGCNAAALFHKGGDL